MRIEKRRTPALLPFLCVCLAVAAALISCNKEMGAKHCWMLIDANGNDYRQVCDKTEAELKECAANGTCTGVAGSINLSSCNYYKTGGEVFCWFADGRFFIKNVSAEKLELLKRCFGIGSAVKVDCNYCGNWYMREKRIYKPTSSTVYSTVRIEQFCGDTVRTLYHGREITRKDDMDSLILIQFSNSGVFF